MTEAVASLTPKQKGRVQEFLGTLRLGLDIGEKAGGIAVVKGNEILHAETFVDFHNVDLEKRRTLRRGRRTRHARKMRFARLRSWILRQKLDDGHRLPDPHKVMRDESLHPKAKGCLEKAKSGAATLEEFVKALTLVFQKRGFKWEGNEDLQSMSMTDFKSFLQQARVPPEMREEFEAEIGRRSEEPDDDGQPLAPKDKAELEQALKEAIKRKPQPRVAEHRMFREKELEEVVRGFCGKQAPRQANAWSRQLNGLLNKVVRQPRFDNRVVSGCSWCNHKTPRKGKESIRESTYLAVLCNLRKQESDFRKPRPLTNEEKRPLIELWDKRASLADVKTARHEVLDILKKLDLVYDANVLTNVAGNMRPKKLQRLLAKRSEAQRTIGSQMADILKGPARGRARLCAKCLGLAAQGKTKKDAGVEWQALANRRSKNPCRKQRDRRVLHRLERLLFKENSWGQQVSIITIEAPEPKTLRAPKGKTTQRQPLSLKERLLLETSQKCFFQMTPDCPKEQELSKDTAEKAHIFPKGRGPNAQENLIAACKSCNKDQDDRTPWEWLGHDVAKWEVFEKRVKAFAASQRKKYLLLCKDRTYPDDPTPLARVSSRLNEFIAELMEMFRRNGCEPPRLSYTPEAAHVQVVDGRWTAYLRRSWRAHPSGEQNFTVKTAADLLNHAQDAALLAATPPHTWRSQIRCESILFDGKPNPGAALRALAPRWSGWEGKLKNRSTVRVLGQYRSSSKRQQGREVFVGRRIDPKSGEAVFTKRVALSGIEASNAGRIFDPSFRAQALEYFKKNSNAKSLPESIGEQFGRPFGNHARRIQIIDKDANENRVASTGGRWLVPQPSNESLDIWRHPDGKIGFHVRRNPMFFKDAPYADPPQKDSKLLRRLARNETLGPLPKKGKYPEGFYIVRKIQRKGSLVLAPEHFLPGYGSSDDEGAAEGENSEKESKLQRTIGKQEMIRVLRLDLP